VLGGLSGGIPFTECNSVFLRRLYLPGEIRGDWNRSRDHLTQHITSLMYAIDATYQGGMGRAVGGIFTADGDNERVFRCVILAFLRHYDVLLLSLFGTYILDLIH